MTASPRSMPTWLLVMTEVLLTCVTFAVVLGFGRVFTGAEFGVSLTVVALYSHLALAALRRAGRGVLVSLVVSVVGLVLVMTWLWFRDTTTLGLPTSSTLEAVRASFSEAVDVFQSVLAPAPPVTGFLVAAAVAIFASAFLADWAAFRLWSGIEALVPPLTLFVFCSLLGSEQLRAPAALAFALTTLAFFVTHRTARRTLHARWVTDDEESGAWSLVRTGLVMTVCVGALGTLVVGQRLPGADQNAIVSWRDDGDGPSDRFTISPLVEINTRLVEQADVELFTVRSAEPAYWRLTALETFDGSAWRSKGRFTEAGEELGQAPAAANPHDLVQDYDIERLGGLWLPAAMIPERLEGDIDASYHEDSSTLIVDSSSDTADGFSYTITSGVGTFDPEALRTADTAIPPGIADRYLALPDDFSTTAADLAEQQTAGLPTRYDKMRALQDWFQSDEFTYDLEAPPGHSEEAIDAFLQTKRGYCEQFAGTFAAMARSLGVPSRVAVGFTQGEQDAGDPNLYRVRGLHAHAWPEVWLGEFGWVAFEPTKSRGAPNAERWTGLRPQQASGPEESTSTTSGTGSTQTTTSPARPSTTLDPAAGSDGASELDTGTRGEIGTGPADEPRGNVARFASVTLIVLILVVVLAGLWVLMLVLARRRLDEDEQGEVEAGRAPGEHVRRAWSDALDQLELVGVQPAPQETHTEFAAREATTLPQAGPALITLARTTDLATFAPDAVDAPLAEEARVASRTVIDQVAARMTPSQRVRSMFDPRPVWRRWRRERPRD